MRTCNLVSWFMVVVMMSTVRPAAAQEGGTSIGVGYQYLRLEDSSFPLGVNVDVVRGVPHRLAIVGDFGWGRSRAESFGFRDVKTAWNIDGGLRWRLLEAARLQPYAQVLFGIERDVRTIDRFGSEAVSNPLLEPAVGVMVRFPGHGQSVFAQAGLRRILDDGDGVNTFRLLTGIRLDLGSRSGPLRP